MKKLFLLMVIALLVLAVGVSAASITVSRAGNGKGTVTSSPPGIACYSTPPRGVTNDCVENFRGSGNVVLTATPDSASRSTFGGWATTNSRQPLPPTCARTSLTCTLRADQARAVRATFNPAPPAPVARTLTINKAGTGAGNVESMIPGKTTANGIDCRSAFPCSKTYTSTVPVTLRAVPDPASRSTFGGWSGACRGTGTCRVTVNAAKTVTATFNPAAATGGGGTTTAPAPVTVYDWINRVGSVKQDISTDTSQFQINLLSSGITVSRSGKVSSLRVSSGYIVTLYDDINYGGASRSFTQDVNALSVFSFDNLAESAKVRRMQCGDGFTDSDARSDVTNDEVCDPQDPATQYSTQGCAPTADGYATRKECNGAAAGQNACKGYGQCVASERCGDGILNGPEQCDGTNLGTPAATCLDQGFSGGTLGCHPAGTASQCQFNTQQCVRLVKLTVEKTGSGTGGVAVSPTGTSCGEGCTEYALGTEVTVTATLGGDSRFGRWTVAQCEGSGVCTFTLNADTTITKEFVQLVPLTITPFEGDGTGTVRIPATTFVAQQLCSLSPCDMGPYDLGSTVVLTATPAADSEVESWGGACEGTPAEQETCDVTMDAAKDVAVNFKKKAFCGDGVIQMPNNEGVDEECDGTNINEQTCELQGFSGGSLRCSLSCSLDTTACTYRLAVAKEGSGSGTVSTSGAGIMCGADCEQDYTPESPVTLSAQAAAGSRFTGWSGACSGTGQCTVKMDAEKTVIAAFELLPDLEVADAYWDVAGAQVTSGTLSDEATPVAVIRNSGGGVAENFKVSIEIYKGTTNKRTEMSSETYSLAPGEEQIIDFSAPYRFTELGDFDIKVWVDSTPAKPGSVIETNEDNNIRTTRKAGATGITAAGVADRSMTIEPACGDGQVNQASEQCEGGTQQCLADGYSGEQACTPAGSVGECTWAACASTESCGDGILNGPERNPGGCDFGQNNDDATTSRTAGIYTDFVEPGYEQQATAFYCSASCESRQETVVGPRCGDGAVTDAEVCDGAEVGGESCVSQGFIDGPLECSADCTTFDTSQCISQVCGNGAVEGTEACDDGNEADGDYCSATCTEVTGSCGDSVQQSNEACDDGNEVTETQCTEYGGQGDFCSADCSQQVTFECPRCGDGQVAEGYEACDDGNTETEACAYGEQSCTVCSAACQEEAGAFSYCGDSNTDTVNGEDCDNGLDLNGQVCVADYGGQSCSYCTDQCTTAVEVAPRLGDGQINGDEACDPAGAGNEDDMFPAGWDNCGSLGFVADTGYLRCDENGDIEPVCTLCGNGAIDVGETCDGTNFGTATCESEGFAGGGDLSCTASCFVETGQCVAGAPDLIVEDAYFVDGNDARITTAKVGDVIRGGVDIKNQGNADAVPTKVVSGGRQGFILALSVNNPAGGAAHTVAYYTDTLATGARQTVFTVKSQNLAAFETAGQYCLQRVKVDAESGGEDSVDESNEQNNELPNPSQVCIDVIEAGSTVQTFTVSGVAFEDKDRDSVQDTGEAGSVGDTVALYTRAGTEIKKRSDGTEFKTITDENGEYSFENVPAGDDYRVTYTVPSGYELTTDNSVVIIVDKNVVANFGIVTSGTAQQHELSVSVLTGNGARDLIDQPTGLVVDLSSSIACGSMQGQSGASVDYTRCSATYAAGASVELRATPSAISSQTAWYGCDYVKLGSTGRGVCALVMNSRENVQAVFTLDGHIVKGVLFEDVNLNGVYDAGETKIEGVTVSISGPYSFSSKTNSDGRYLFVLDQPNTYTLTYVVPEGYVATNTVTHTIRFEADHGYFSVINFGVRRSIAPAQCGNGLWEHSYNEEKCDGSDSTQSVDIQCSISTGVQGTYQCDSNCECIAPSAGDSGLGAGTGDSGTGTDTGTGTDIGTADTSAGGEVAADEGTGTVYACEPTMPGYTDDGAFQWADNDYDEDGALNECDPFDSTAGCDLIEECVGGGWQTYS